METPLFRQAPQALLDRKVRKVLKGHKANQARKVLRDRKDPWDTHPAAGTTPCS